MQNSGTLHFLLCIVALCIPPFLLLSCFVYPQALHCCNILFCFYLSSHFSALQFRYCILHYWFFIFLSLMALFFNSLLHSCFSFLHFCISSSSPAVPELHSCSASLHLRPFCISSSSTCCTCCTHSLLSFLLRLFCCFLHFIILLYYSLFLNLGHLLHPLHFVYSGLSLYSEMFRLSLNSIFFVRFLLIFPNLIKKIKLGFIYKNFFLVFFIHFI